MVDLGKFLWTVSALFLCFSANCGAAPGTPERDVLQQSIMESMEPGPPGAHAQFRKTGHSLNSSSTKGPGTATISGTARDGGTGMQDLYIKLYSFDQATGQLNSEGYLRTDSLGVYSFSALPAGTYVLYLHDFIRERGYIPLIWDPTGGTPCNAGICPPDAINLITLAAGASEVANFSLHIGGTISGRIVDAVTGAGVDTLIAYAYRDRLRLYADVDPAGDYTIHALPDGDFQLYVSAESGVGNQHIGQLYGGGECNPRACDFLASSGLGTPIPIIAPGAVTGMDFNVSVGASVTGRLLDAATSQPIDSLLGLVWLFDNINMIVALEYVDGLVSDPMATGNYTVGGLMPGDYFLLGSGWSGDYYIPELYNNVHCPWYGCDRSGFGHPVSFLPVEHKVGFDFLLDKGGKISGAIQDSAGINLTGDRYVQVYDNTGKVIGGGRTRSGDGNHETYYGLPPGDHVVRSGNLYVSEFHNAPYIDERYDGDACPGESCDLSTATPLVNVVANSTTSGINFTLETGHSFTGTVTDLVSGLPIPDVYVLVYDSIGRYATNTLTDAAGSFTISGLPAGTFYALTNNGSRLPFLGMRATPPSGWIDILYDSIPCPGGACDVTTGTAITLPTRGTGIDFVLQEGGTIAGSVLFQGNGAPVPSCLIEVFNEQGDFRGAYFTNDDGDYQTVGLDSGSYYLRTRNPGFLLDETYGGEYCLNGACDPLSAQPVSVTSPQQTSEINFSLRADYLFSSQF